MKIFQSLTLLTDYRPKNEHFTSKKEIDYITDTLDLYHVTDDDLINLRDFCVMMWSQKYQKLRLENDESWWDIMQSMQSITSVIDLHKWKRNMAV